MPVRRDYEPVPVNVSDGGRYLPDLPPSRIGPANYDEKINFRRDDECEIKIEGWDFPQPTDDWIGDGLANFNDGMQAEAIRTVRRANGDVAVVGCGAGFIKWFDYDSNAWVTIGSGYSTSADAGFRFWQIVDCANYAVFNNGRDLMCTWQIGDAAVTPNYEFREQGYASCGDICEYNGILRCADILEINDDAMAAVMTDPLPYKTIVDGANTTRIVYRRVWSNIDNPRDFGATAPASIAAASAVLTLSWPMRSFAVGDPLIVSGAGSAGGNLTTTINSISPDGLTVTLANAASTSVTGRDAFNLRALETIVGNDDLGDDGSAIVRQMVLKNRMISFKASGDVFEEYYDGDLDHPFIAERMVQGTRGLRFPRSLVNVRDEYLLFPGDVHFYRYTLGSQTLAEDSTVFGAKKKKFFSRVKGAGKYDVWAADNGATGEIIFAYPWAAYSQPEYGANWAIAYNYNEGRETVAEIDDFAFTCAATIQKPIADRRVEETEQWFMMGDGDGKFTRWGASNLEIFTLLRYGEKFTASLGCGLFSAGRDTKAKRVRRFTLLPADPNSSSSVDVTIYGADTTNAVPVALETKTLNDPDLPGVMPLDYRSNYLKYRLESDADVPLRISGHVWEVAISETGDIGRLR